jgi:DNA adenine methylase
MFRQIRNHPEWFEEQIKYIPYSYELYKEYLETLDSKELDDREKALRFLYCIASSFNGEIQTKSWKVHKYVALPTVWNHKSLIIRQIAKRLMTVYIDHDDFRKVIRRWDSKNTLFFCDPPYYKAEKMYTYGFTEFDHVALKNILSTIRGKFLLIYDDCKEIREMYKDFIIEQISAKIYMENIIEGKRTTKDYLLIRNYTLEKKVSEFGTQH